MTHKIITSLWKTMLCMLLSVNLCGCAHQQTGIAGFDGVVTLDTTAETLKQNPPIKDLTIADETDWYISYDDVVFNDKYNGSLQYIFSEDTLEVTEINFNPDSDIDSIALLEDLSTLYGEPVHKENYNDKRISQAYYMYRTDSMDIIVTITTGNAKITQVEYLYKYSDEARLKEEEERQAYREVNPEVQEAVDLMYELTMYNQTPISITTDHFGLKFKDFQPIANSDDSYLLFTKDIDFIGYDATLVFRLEAPTNEGLEHIGYVTDNYIYIDAVPGNEELEATLEKSLGEIEVIGGSKKIQKGPMNVYIDTAEWNGKEMTTLEVFRNLDYFRLVPEFNSTTDLTEYTYRYDEVTEIDYLMEVLQDYLDKNYPSTEVSVQQQSTQFVPKGETPLMSFIRICDLVGYSIYQPSNDNGVVTARLKNTEEDRLLSGVFIRYYSQDNKVSRVDIVAETAETYDNDTFKAASLLLGVALNQSLSSDDCMNAVHYALETDQEYIFAETQFLPDRASGLLSISY